MKRQTVRDILGPCASLQMISMCLSGFTFSGYVDRIQSLYEEDIGRLLGIQKLLELKKNANRQGFLLQRWLLESFSARFPGIIDALTLECKCTSECCCENALESACSFNRIAHAHFLLDVGAKATSGACDQLLIWMKYPMNQSVVRLLKRLIRHGGFPTLPAPKHITYKKQFESARDGSLTLIGIRKHKRSPLIPDGVHLEIIKAIAHQIRQRHEEIEFEVSLKKIKV